MKSERVVLITAAAGGVGRLLVDQFLANGDTVVATDTSQDALDALRQANQADSAELVTAVSDVSSGPDCTALLQTAEQDAGPVDVLINCAGYFPIVHDHVLAQLDLADACADDPAGRDERQARLTVVAVGAGYSGTEFVAQRQLWISRVADRWEWTSAQDVRWLLVDLAPTVLPELGPQLDAVALDLLRKRGVEVRLGVSVAAATATSVTLTDGDEMPAYTLVWGAGVTANPLVATLGRPLERGRLVVDEQLRVPGLRGVGSGRCRRGLRPKQADRGPRPAGDTADGSARPAARRRAGPQHAASLGVGTARRSRTATSAWWQTSAVPTASPSRSACRSAAASPKPSPASTTSIHCPATPPDPGRRRLAARGVPRPAGRAAAVHRQ